MAERAKLRYHGKAYYDEDMIAIAKKELNFNGLKFVGYKLDREKLMMVGQEVASLWGASCIKYHVDKKNKVVMFECIEHGEEFVTSIEFSKLKEYL